MTHFSAAKRIVIKLGTQVVMDANGRLAEKRMAHLIEQVALLKIAGKQPIIVTSGAVGLGARELGMKLPLTLPEKQACAAVGQNLLMNYYQKFFSQFGCKTAQVLLTARDLSIRSSYTALQDTLETLLKHSVIPVLNENDSVSTEELTGDNGSKAFGDNDKLSALVAAKMGAHLLVILTNVDGIYSDNPEKNPHARRIAVIDSLKQLNSVSVKGKSALGRGGMRSKIEAAKVAALCGVPTVIASGLVENAIAQAMSEGSGTLVTATKGVRGKKKWIGFSTGVNGSVAINHGAKIALLKNGASLLPSGIIGVTGRFSKEQVIGIEDESGHELGRGIVAFSSEDVKKILGLHTSEAKEILGLDKIAEVIHRDELVVFEDGES